MTVTTHAKRNNERPTVDDVKEVSCAGTAGNFLSSARLSVSDGALKSTRTLRAAEEKVLGFLFLLRVVVC